MDTKDEVVQLYLDDIIPNRFQPREVFDEKALKELALSIKEHGVIQPIIVRNVNGKYEIIAGERRYKASALAGQTKIPAIIRDMDDKESSKVALLENLQRKNLSPIEEARTYQKILELDQMTQEELAATMGKSQSAVANKLRLLSLPDEVQDAVLKEKISERHARDLLMIPEPSVQKDMMKKIIDTKMSVRQLEEEIKNMYPKDNPVAEMAIPEISETVPEQVDIEVPEVNSIEEPTFINYGEVNKEAEKMQDIPNQLNTDMVMEHVDINQMMQNSANIGNNNGGDLDSLLNINGMGTGPAISGSEYQYVTPAEGIVQTETVEMPKPTGDFFKQDDDTEILDVDDTPSFATPPVINEVPQDIPTNDNFQLPAEEIEVVNNPVIEETVDSASSKIKELVEELKSQGIKISMDEMDFDNVIQYMIKIERD